MLSGEDLQRLICEWRYHLEKSRTFLIKSNEIYKQFIILDVLGNIPYDRVKS